MIRLHLAQKAATAAERDRWLVLAKTLLRKSIRAAAYGGGDHVVLED